MSKIKQLNDEGQSIWLDYIRRNLLESGELEKLVREEGITGVTSNPSIFQKAITGSEEYDDDIRAQLKENPHASPQDLYESIAVKDIQMAADVLRPVYDETDGKDGFVSLEVNPHLARDTAGTIEEAKRLWSRVDRPNLMIKVPATDEGIPAIEALIAEGINVNVTLMFSLDHYENVANAYIRGLEKCEDPSSVASVASFFISRVTRAVDGELDELDSDEANELLGEIAIANAKKTYKRFEEIFYGDRFAELRDQGAYVQRVLWASTSTKNPNYSDVRYVEELIGPDTVNTVPPETLNAFRDHGSVRGSTIKEEVDRAEEQLEALDALGIDLDEITEHLQEKGVQKFADPFDDLMETLQKQKEELQKKVNPQILNLGETRRAVEDRLENWQREDVARRIWSKDHTVWFDEDPGEITNRLGWLELPKLMQKELDDLEQLSDEIKDSGWTDVVLLGMGGSSLAPEVFQRTFDNAEGHPELTVLDSTHPDAVTDVEDRIDLEHSLFIVASKSGTTTETMSLFNYFWDRIEAIEENPGQRFIANTDPGTPLEQLGLERNFRHVFRNPTDLGGRYSALAFFGLMPAAVIGMDVHKFLDRAWTLSESCSFCVSAPENDALRLGVALGELAKAGKDKLTFVTTPALSAFPDWLEQLIAESTGKNDTGIVPVAHEPEVAPSSYGDDRVFVFLTHSEEVTDELDERRLQLKDEGHPVISIKLEDTYDLSQEIFRWELAISAAGAVMGIHPFNQPNVERAKELAREAMEDSSGDDEQLDIETLRVEEDPEAAAERLGSELADRSAQHYIALQAYVNPTDSDVQEHLDALRELLLNRTNCATTFGYGPRFLHSTGQLHKGGPNTGQFIQLVDDASKEVPVPETDYSFNELIQAQARGDYRALSGRNRQVTRIHLGSDPAKTVSELLEHLNGPNF